MMKLSTKLFNKSYDIPSKPLVIAMCKKSNGRLVKLCVTPIQLYQITDKTKKAVQVGFSLRYQIRNDILRLEKDECDPFEYTIVGDTLVLNDKLQTVLPMLDYQNYYHLEKLMGSGSFASVYSARKNEDHRLFAAKAFLKKQLNQKDPLWRFQIENEIQVIKQLDHPNILKVYAVFENQAQVYLITDLARGGTLTQCLKKLEGPLPFLSAKVLFRQIVEGVKHMHSNGFMHRDLKPSNIIFKRAVPLQKYGLDQQDNNVLISDFGVASKIDQFDVYSYCGSPGYMAPEVFQCEKDNTIRYNEKCDIFSLGCILYQLVTNKMLFQSNSHAEQKQLNMECKLNWYEIEREVYGSRQLTILLQRMLSMQSDQRPSCDEILQSPIMHVEYDDKGYPVFKDYKRPFIPTLQVQMQKHSITNTSRPSLKRLNYLNEPQKPRGNTIRIKRQTNHVTRFITDSELN